MYCTNCGHKLVNVVYFCNKCGHRLSNPNTEYTVNVKEPRAMIANETSKGTAVNTNKKKSKLPLAVIVVLIAAILLTTSYTLLKNRYLELADSQYSIGNSAHNVGQGGLVAVHDDWIFYANPNFEGALFAKEIDSKKSFQLTDFPVANLNVLDDNLVFTDIYGSYYIEKMEDGTEKYSIPNGTQILDTLLKRGENKQIIFGGNLYVLSGVKDLIKKKSLEHMVLKQMDTSGSPAYSVSVIDRQLQYVFYDVSSKKNKTSSDGYRTPITMGCIISHNVQFLSLIDSDEIDEDQNDSGYRMQNIAETSIRDRKDRVLYWYDSITNNINQKIEETKAQWSRRFDIFHGETVVKASDGRMAIGQKYYDPRDGWLTKNNREIKGVTGDWSFLGIHGLPEVNGITYIQVYRNEETSSGYEVGEVQIWAVDRKTGKKLNSYSSGLSMDMVIQGDKVYYHGKDGYLYQIIDGKEPEAISAMPVKNYEFFYNGDVLISYNRDDGAESQAVLSENDYKKEVYQNTTGDDGVVRTKGSGWYTHTDKSRFDELLPVKTYRGHYYLCDDTKYEILKDESGDYQWYRIEKDYRYTLANNMGLPPQERREEKESSKIKPDKDLEIELPKEKDRAEKNRLKDDLDGTWICEKNQYEIELRKLSGKEYEGIMALITSSSSFLKKPAEEKWLYAYSILRQGKETSGYWCYDNEIYTISYSDSGTATVYYENDHIFLEEDGTLRADLYGYTKGDLIFKKIE